jgi:osmoprotectant transport system ATP-binding protein
MDAIVFDHVTKVYPPAQAAEPGRAGASAAAVDDVSLEIPAGEIVVLLGTSGSGKTTLLKMVNRLQEPTAGRIFVEGIEVHDLPPDALRRRIGYVIQQIGLFPHWTVAQNVATVPRLLGWDKRRVDERVDALLDLLGLPPAEYRKRYPSQLSGGQQQRVGIARALAGDPDIMLMDEPFGAVDAVTRSRLQAEFLAIQDRTHKTVLFVTHDVEEALRLADRLVIMSTGRIVQHDTPFNVVARPANPFVAELVGAGDVTRLLRLVTVRSALRPLQPAVAGRGLDPLHLEDSLRDALARLLQEGVDALPVAGGDGRLVGQVDLQSMREQLRAPVAPTGETVAEPS